MFPFVVALIVLCFATSQAVADLDTWPEHCCRLVMKEHSFGDELPKDMIIGATTDGKRWGYGRDSDGDGHALVISENRRERPIKFSDSCNELDWKSFQVLTNPHKCSIGWYKTRYDGEGFSDDVKEMADGAIIFPDFETHKGAYHHMFGKRSDGGIGIFYGKRLRSFCVLSEDSRAKH